MYPGFVLKGLDVERMLYLYDAGRYGEAVRCCGCILACGRLLIPVRAPCEKACRRVQSIRPLRSRHNQKELAGRVDYLSGMIIMWWINVIRMCLFPA